MKSIIAMLKSELEMIDYEINCVTRSENNVIDRVKYAKSQQSIRDLADTAQYWGKRKHDLKTRREGVSINIAEIEANMNLLESY